MVKLIYFTIHDNVNALMKYVANEKRFFKLFFVDC